MMKSNEKEMAAIAALKRTLEERVKYLTDGFHYKADEVEGPEKRVARVTEKEELKWKESQKKVKINVRERVIPPRGISVELEVLNSDKYELRHKKQFYEGMTLFELEMYYDKIVGTFITLKDKPKISTALADFLNIELEKGNLSGDEITYNRLPFELQLSTKEESKEETKKRLRGEV